MKKSLILNNFMMEEAAKFFEKTGALFTGNNDSFSFLFSPNPRSPAACREGGIRAPPPGPPGFADARVLRPDANRTLLYVTSPIPVVKP
jgi:hypothetical protein